MKAIILAAGYATRLYPLTENMPKALLKVGSKAILEHLLDAFAFVEEIDEIHIVSNARFYEQLSEWAKGVQPGYRQNIIVWNDGTTSNENRLGAIGDILFVINQANIDDDLFIAASDNLLSRKLTEYFDDFKAHKCDFLLAGRMEDPEERKRYAILQLDENRRVIDLEEKPQNPKSDIAAYAEYIYTRETIPLIKTYIEEGNNPDSPGHLPEWLYKKKEVRAHIYEGDCVDIGTVKMYNEIQNSWK
ncbi:MAG: nucleotidyltransferase family protein [Clostridia bacterium]|nr:nucleotidyltransferase family protein [Clostridia bacterium]